MRQSVKILKIKDINSAKNGLHILSVLYKTNHKDILAKVLNDNCMFLPTKSNSIHWDIEDIINIKQFLGDGMELEFTDILEAA